MLRAIHYSSKLCSFGRLIILFVSPLSIYIRLSFKQEVGFMSIEVDTSLLLIYISIRVL